MHMSWSCRVCSKYETFSFALIQPIHKKKNYVARKTHTCVKKKPLAQKKNKIK